MAGTQTSGPILIYDDDNFYMGGVLALHLRAQGHEVHLITPLPEISAWTIHTLKQPRIVRKLTVEAVSWDVNLTLHAVEHDSARFVCSYTGEVKKDVPGLWFDGSMMLTRVKSGNPSGVTSCQDAPLSWDICTMPSSEPDHKRPS